MYKLPSRLFRKNRLASAIDNAVIASYKNDYRYNFIRESVPVLTESPKPSAYKEISKVLYVNDITPPISKQGHDSKLVLGATGEALTELIFPAQNELESNNRGYDLKINASLIEVKSSVEDKVSMSNVQYRKSDYLVIHIYNKYNDFYQYSYLIPMRILRKIKGKKDGRVSVNIYKENWVKRFKITLIRISQFSKIRNRYIRGETRSIVHVINRDILYLQVNRNEVHVQAIFEMYSSFNSWKWELNYAYYEYYYHKTLDWQYDYKCLSDIEQ